MKIFAFLKNKATLGIIPCITIKKTQSTQCFILLLWLEQRKVISFQFSKTKLQIYQFQQNCNVFAFACRHYFVLPYIFVIKFGLLVEIQTQRSGEPPRTGQRSTCSWSEWFPCRFFGGHATPSHPKVKAACCTEPHGRSSTPHIILTHSMIKCTF